MPGVQALVAFRTQMTPANPSGLRLSSSPGPPQSLHSELGCQHRICRQAIISSLNESTFLNTSKPRLRFVARIQAFWVQRMKPHMNTLRPLAWRRAVRLSGVALVVPLGLLAAPFSAQATVSGGCTATATASKSGAIDLAVASSWHVKDADVLNGQATAPTPQKSAQLKVLLFGIGLPLLDKQGNSVSGAAGPYRIADYDHYTRVLAVAGTSNTCDGSILIIVDDVAPLSTWAGILGVIAALLGIIGLVATMFQFPSGSARVVGMVVGVVAGLGTGLLLQQDAILDPANFLGLLLPGGGAILGLILPGIAYRGRTAPTA